MKQINKKAIIIGCGIAGPTLAIALNKIGIESEIYEAESKPSNFGLLSLTTNGINILKMIDVYKDVQVDDTAGVFFYNHAGKNIFTNDFGSWLKEQYGSGMIIIRRERLIHALIKKAISNGTKIEFGKKLSDVNETEDKVIATFEDGTNVEGDFLIGCDGLRSKTRAHVLSDSSSSPVYSGIVVVGSELDPNTKHDMVPNAFHMTLAKQTLSGCSVETNNDLVWWSYVPYPEELIKTELKNITPEQWTKKLLDLHKDDTKIRELIKLTKDDYVKIPIYDLPHLDTWHKGRICIIGDAAHATSPHIGQGAAASMEDAIVLAKCLRDIPDLDESFTKFEKLRKPRVEKIVKESQTSAKFFLRRDPLTKLFARIMMFFTLRDSNFRKRQNWIFSYKIDWDKKIPI